jgi:hypothetical protein
MTKHNLRHLKQHLYMLTNQHRQQILDQQSKQAFLGMKL